MIIFLVLEKFSKFKSMFLKSSKYFSVRIEAFVVYIVSVYYMFENFYPHAMYFIRRHTMHIKKAERERE